MLYNSTSGQYAADLRGAITKCFAPDGSLYLPATINPIPQALFNNIWEMTPQEIGYVVAAQLLGPEVDRAALKHIVDDTFCIPIKYQALSPTVEVMELFNGPTMAFKDFSARFAANVINRWASPKPEVPRLAIVATMGNTGAAVAEAFGRTGDSVVVLLPRKALRSQIVDICTTPNIHFVEVDGDINQCKTLVRRALADEQLAKYYDLICVNTSNFLRIIPQVALFFCAYAHIEAETEKKSSLTVSMPCGNLSMLLSAVIAKRLGLPLKQIIAGCTANASFVKVLDRSISPSEADAMPHQSLAFALETGYPTNLDRIIKIYDGDIDRLSADVQAFPISDEEIVATIQRLADSGHLVDPHTAVAVAALDRAGLSSDQRAVVMATSHPQKAHKAPSDSPRIPIIAPSLAALRKYILATCRMNDNAR